LAEIISRRKSYFACHPITAGIYNGIGIILVYAFDYKHILCADICIIQKRKNEKAIVCMDGSGVCNDA